MADLIKVLANDAVLKSLYDNINEIQGAKAHIVLADVAHYLGTETDPAARTRNLSTLLSIRKAPSTDGISLFDSKTALMLEKVARTLQSGSNNGTIDFFKTPFAEHMMDSNSYQWSIAGPNSESKYTLTSPYAASLESTQGPLELHDSAVFLFSGIVDAPDNYVAMMDIMPNGAIDVYRLDLSSGEYVPYAIPVPQKRVEAPATHPSPTEQLPEVDVPAVLRATQPDSNSFVLSSYSVLDALSMLFAGLSKSDYQRVAQQFNLSPDLRAQLEEAQRVRQDLTSTPGVTVTISNAAMVAQDFLSQAMKQ